MTLIKSDANAYKKKNRISTLNQRKAQSNRLRLSDSLRTNVKAIYQKETERAVAK